MAAEWIGTAATAVVGITGISATLWITLSDRRARERRALADEKGRTYSTVFVQGDRVVGAIKRVNSYRERGDVPGQLVDALAELEDSRLALNSAIYDLLLVAPPAVASEAADLYFLHLDAVQRVRTGEEGYEPASLAASRRSLLNLMRADLGRVPVSVRDSPSMARISTGMTTSTDHIDQADASLQHAAPIDFA